MSTPIFSKDDVVLLRKPVMVALACVSFSVILYLLVGYLNTAASNANQLAQSQYDQVQTSIQQIAQEEATIIEYIDRYRQMVDDTLFEVEDRLALLERVQTIRSALRLFPIDVEIAQQSSHPLSYAPEEVSPGEPVNLLLSHVRMSLPLLHEEDLTGLLNELLAGRGHFIPYLCMLRSTVSQQGYVAVADNLAAECRFYWLTFQVNPTVAEIVE